MTTGVSTDISSFITLLSMEVLGCPTFLKQQAIRQSAMEFFRETRCWREVVEEYTLVGGDKEIDANQLAKHISRASVALEVNDLWLTDDGTPLKKLSHESLDKNISGWRTDTAKEPTGYFMKINGNIRIYPALEDDADDVDVDVELILISTMTTETFPDFAYNLHSETIVAGAAHRLMVQPEQVWSSPDRAAYFLEKFKKGLRDSRLEEAKRVVDALNAKNRTYFR